MLDLFSKVNSQNWCVLGSFCSNIQGADVSRTKLCCSSITTWEYVKAISRNICENLCLACSHLWYCRCEHMKSSWRKVVMYLFLSLDCDLDRDRCLCLRSQSPPSCSCRLCDHHKHLLTDLRKLLYWQLDQDNKNDHCQRSNLETTKAHDQPLKTLYK